MRIVVPVKRVVDPYAKVRALPDGSAIDTSGVKFDVNPFDEIAVEEAVRIKDRLPDSEIVAVSIGPREAEDQLRKALAMGADRGILIVSEAATDSLGVAECLADVVREQQPDVVLMGKQATDDDSNQAGQMLAALLGWPQATFASKIEFEDGQAVVTRETDTGEETVAVPLPCVITADLRLNEPRYIALPGIIKARSKPIDVRDAVALPEPKVRVLRYSDPPSRPPGRRVSSVAELVEELKARGAL